MHATLSIGSSSLMISDAMPDQTAQPGSNTHVCLQYADVAEWTRSLPRCRMVPA